MRSESLENTLVGQATIGTIVLDKPLSRIAQKQPTPDLVTKNLTSAAMLEEKVEEQEKVEMSVEQKEEKMKQNEEKMKQNEEKMKQNEEKMKQNEEKMKQKEEKMKQKEEEMKQKEEKIKQKGQADSTTKDYTNDENTDSQNKDGPVTDLHSSKSADHVVMTEEGSGGVTIRRRMVNRLGSFRRKSQFETSDSNDASSDDSDTPVPNTPLRRLASFRRMRPRSNISLQGDSASEDSENSDAPSAPTITRRFGSLKKMSSFKRKGHLRNGSAPVYEQSSTSLDDAETTPNSNYRGPSLFAQRNDDLAYDFATSADEENHAEKKQPEEPVQTGIVRTFNGFGGASGVGRQNDTFLMMSSKKKTTGTAKQDQQLVKPNEENESNDNETNTETNSEI